MCYSDYQKKGVKMIRFPRIFLFITLVSSLLLSFPSFSFSQEAQVWTNLGLYGGQVTDIAIDPANPNKMFAATYKGDGLFVTEDGGSSWQAVEMANEPEYEGTFKNHSVYAVKIAPSNNNVIWVTYDYWVAKSTDGGQTWTHISINNNNYFLRVCMSVAVDPSDPQTVYVGTSGTDGDNNSGSIFKTEDGGESWELMCLLDYTVRDIDIDPQNNNTIWAVTNSDGAGEGLNGTLYRSGDGGESWNQMFSLGGYHTVAVKPNDSNVVFTGSRFGVDKVYFDGSSWRLWPLTFDSTYAVSFDPQDPDTLYTSSSGSVGKSNDEGITWQTYQHDKIFWSLAVHPTNSDVIIGGDIYLGIYKGVYDSQVDNYTWTPINNGINAVIVYDVAIDPNESTHILAGTISGIYEKREGKSWSRILDHSTDSVLFHPTDSQTFYAGLQARFAKTVNGGASWTYWFHDDTYNFVKDIAIDSSNMDTIFIAVASAGGDYGEIYKSTDGGDSFNKVLDGVNLYGQKYGFNVVAIDPSDPHHIFAGGGNVTVPVVLGDLWESTNGGTDWTRTGLRYVFVNALLIDPRNPNIMYAGCGASGGTDVPVYMSTDGGDTWVPSHQGIPGPKSSLLGLFGISGTDVFAVGSDGYIFHYDGTTWTPMRSSTVKLLWDVWASSADKVFAVGDNWNILHYDGNDWTIDVEGDGTFPPITSVWGSSETDIFAVDYWGGIYHYDGNPQQSWTIMVGFSGNSLFSVWGSSGTDVFAVGAFGTILHYDGITWTIMVSSSTENLSSVWGSSETDVFAAGENGTILHYDGTSWTPMVTPSTEHLSSVWGSSGTDAFAAGNNGTILHYDGTTWTTMVSPSTENLSSVWGSSGTDVFALSYEGSILHYNGNSWTVMKPAGKEHNSVTDLEFHPQNPDVIYASTSLQGAYVSPNQAGKWLNLGAPEYTLYALSTGSLYAATEGGLLQCTGTGLIAGRIVDAFTGIGIDNATVYTDFGVECISVAGEYMMVHPSGIFTITGTADDCDSITKHVTVLGGDVSWTNFSMESGYPEPSLSPGSSDTSSSVKYCFIATAAYGSPLAKQVKILRQFRDSYLLPHAIGQKLVALYYRTGKPIAMYIESHPWLKPPIRALLYPVVGLAWLAVSTSAITKAFICLCILICGMVVIRRHKTKRKIVKKSASRHAINIILTLSFTILIFTGSSLQAATLFQQVGIASSPNPVGSGARAVGMGGAFIGIADDATAASWNPGGLIQLERPELSIVGDYNYRKEEFSSSSHPEIGNTGEVDDQELNYFSATYPFHFYRNMVVSLNYQRLYDFKRSFDHRYDYSSAGLNLEQYKAFSQDGYIGALGLAGAVQITPKLSLGLTFNIWTDELFWENGWEEAYTEHGVGSIGGAPVTIDTRIEDKYSSFRGINANFGLLWNITNYLTIGAVVKTPFTAHLCHEFSFVQTQTYGAPLDTTSTIQQSIKEDVELDMPLSYGIGLAWRFSDAFSIDLDVYRTDWSEYYLTDDQGNEFSPIDGRPKYQSQVKDTTQIRIGGEYLFIKQKKNMVIPIRAGFFYDPEPSEGSPEDFYGFAVGSGIAYKRFIFDVAYQFRWGKDVDTGNLIATSKADIIQHTFLASLIVHF
jgi:photosystem II stability/assembly factor-like uncharacterized protein/long-subunit fatty acid transport protein